MRISAVQIPALLLALSILVAITACQQGPATNTNSINSNAAATPVSNLNSNTTSSSSPTSGSIDTTEPEAYTADLTLKVQSVGGQQNLTSPAITAKVGRNGSDRRVELKLPGGMDVVYLDKADKRYLLLPGRKQYAELNEASTGVEVQRLMTPGQLVAQLRKQPGYERVGDDVWNGRPVVKYRYAGTARTGTQAAGDVSSETFVYIDKDTGLPLHTETVAEATGDRARGVQTKIVTEMSNISRTVDPAQFALPPDYTRIEDAQVRQQVDAVVRAALAFASQIAGGMQSTTSATPSPTSSPSSSPAR
jgi:hypothetical protein